jgi:hypothetical protein
VHAGTGVMDRVLSARLIILEHFNIHVFAEFRRNHMFHVLGNDILLGLYMNKFGRKKKKERKFPDFRCTNL